MHHSRVLLGALTGLALYLRAHSIGADPRVVFDEVHLGNLANNYMASQFHLNPHPPLGKLLITLLFRAFGYTGGSSFDSGEPHPDFVPYVQMRRVQAVLGTLLVPVVFAACRALRLPEMAGWLAALFVALDNALIGISRINMLDSALLLANAAALYAFAINRHYSQRGEYRTRPLLALGLALALALNIKLVSVSTIIVVGIYILADLVDLTIKSQRQTRECLVIWFKHAVLLGVLPLTIYMLAFWQHFARQTNYTPQADHMGSEFNVRLNGSALQVQPPGIYNTSFVVIRANNYPFDYLNVFQQQKHNPHVASPVLATSQFIKVESYLGIALLNSNNSSPGATMYDGCLVSLSAPKTAFHVSVRNSYIPGSEHRFVGFVEKNGTQSAVDATWTVVHEGCSSNCSRQTQPIATRFRLLSTKHGCELDIDRAHRIVESIDSPFNRNYAIGCVRGKGTVWNIEHQLAANHRPVANITQTVRASFLKNFLSYNRLMYRVNSMLRSDPDQYTIVESAATSWPFLAQPMPLVSWSGDNLKYMLVGNIVLWQASALICIFIHPLVFAMARMTSRRSHGKVVLYQPSSAMHVLWLLWAAHYIPFLFASRATYLHHYLQPLLFAIMLLAAYASEAAMIFAHAIAHATMRAKREQPLRNITFGIVLLVIGGFVYSVPLTYGTLNPCSYHRYSWISMWNVCMVDNVY